jgi:ABC-type multidrug transport system ATPase subunit
VLLLDEPFSLLDVITRMELQDELMRLWETERKTVLMVTHDVDEALLLADRIVLMTNGPAATVGEILTVPFGRPRERLSIVDDPRYHQAHTHLIHFLGERADHGRATAFTALLEKPNRAIHEIGTDELFVVEKYTGFNRFRKKYRRLHAPVESADGLNRLEAKSL